MSPRESPRSRATGSLHSAPSGSNAKASSDGIPLSNPSQPNLIQDDPAAVEAARQRFAKRSRMASLSSLLRGSRKSRKTTGRTRDSEGNAGHALFSEAAEPDANPVRATGLRRELSASARALLTPMTRAKTKPDLHDAITLKGSSRREDDEYQDRFQWAVLYENQRGFTLFSVPHYSSLGLLPLDPAAFTAPQFPMTAPSSAAPANTAPKRGGLKNQSSLSFNDFPLPDGTWRWLSKSWMVDMSSDANRQVQYDGFEYNWLFRSRHWRTEPGKLSTGGLVRRRRWIRLMFRPAQARVHAEEQGADEVQDSQTGDSPLIPQLSNAATSTSPYGSVYGDESTEGSHEHSHRNSWAGSWDGRIGRNYRRFGGPSLEPPSAMGTISESIYARHSTVFVGDSDDDWVRCYAVLHKLGRDGRKLEAWKKWLGQSHTQSETHLGDRLQTKTFNDSARQWSEDTQPMPSEMEPLGIDELRLSGSPPPVEYVVAVLNEHIQDVLELFIYPDTKARFFDLLAAAGVMSQLSVTLQDSADQTGFWSYTSNLSHVGASPSARQSPSSHVMPFSTSPREESFEG